MPRTLIDEAVSAEDLRPTHDHVVVRIVRKDMTSGGIHLPKNTATPVVLAQVVSVGPGIPNNYNGKDFPIRLKPGDYVFFMDYAGERMKVAWKDYRIIREHGLWAKVKVADFTSYDFEEIDPWADRIVLELDGESKTRSGILFLPSKDQKTHWRIGTVWWTGFGVWHLESGKLLPCETKPGDKVVFRRYAGAEITVKSRKYRIVQEVDVQAILEE